MKEKRAAAQRASRARSLAGTVVVLLLLLLGVAGAKGARDLAVARSREAHLGAEIRSTEERIEGLVRRIERLRDDPVTLERLAREELGLVRPGDVVIVFPRADPGPP